MLDTYLDDLGMCIYCTLTIAKKKNSCTLVYTI